MRVPSWVQHCIIFSSTLASYVLAADLPPASSFYVPSIPDIHQDPDRPLTIHAGTLPADPTARNLADKSKTSHLYFVKVNNRRSADKERLMFWFNGGPGCSSFDGLMMEVGPWRMDGKGGFKVQEGGWEEYMTMVYIDQPAGTGFSYTGNGHYVTSLTEAAQQLLEFFKNFYEVFPQYKRMDTYLGGESFAGQYIPYFADAILGSRLDMPLRGVAIGNGWMDARRQYPSYIDFGVRVGLFEENSDEWKVLKKRTDECVTLLDGLGREPIHGTGACFGLMQLALSSRSKLVNGVKMCANVYDIRLDDTQPDCGMNWPPSIHPVTKFLGRPEVALALHGTENGLVWKECRRPVKLALKDNLSNSSITVLPRVVEKIPVMIFAGDQDVICNYIGLEAMIKAMTWNGETGLGKVETQSWSVNGSQAGTWVSSRNLTYVKIFNASHMAPFDVPHVAHDMILRFVGMDFTKVLDGSARVASSLGSNVKPVFAQEAKTTQKPIVPPAKSPEQDKAMWEAYYNAGSAGVVLILFICAIGGFLFWRSRKRKALSLPIKNEEEAIPLNPGNGHGNGHHNAADYA